MAAKMEKWGGLGARRLPELRTGLEHARMKVGLTGGVACGKSLVLEMFAEAGWRTLSADALVHELLDNDAEVREAISGEFGDAAIGEDGSLDRKRIGTVVFGDAEKRAWLEELLHPLVRRRWTAEIEADPETNWIVEIPLLFEKKLEIHFDLVVCLESSQKTQLSRLRSRGLSEADALARISSQAPLAEKIEKSDIVLSNNGSLNFLRKQLSILLERLA